jgi:hypothetical protein
VGAKLWLGGMIAGSVLFIAAVPSRRDPLPPPEPAKQPEEPWLTRDAAAEIIGPDHELGPLFRGIELGGAAPEEDVRDRIAKFARMNHVDIDFEVTRDQLTAVRFEVTYPGCCGNEGAEVLALRLARPKTSPCCGCETDFLDDWAYVTEDGVYMRARTRFNRVEVRWEPAMKLDALLARADELIGLAANKVAREAGDRWIEVEAGHRYSLEVPYRLGAWYGEPIPLRERRDLGLQLTVVDGRISEVAFELRYDDEREIAAAVRKHRRHQTHRLVADGAALTVMSRR